MTDRDPSKFALLGQNQALPDTLSRDILDTFPNHNDRRNYWIKLDCQDFSSLCPVTGQPDFARIRIEYIPGERCVETKSLKYYLAAFRNERAFNEEILNRIADDLLAVCEPRKLFVQGAFASRGGISLTVEANFPDEPVE